MLWRLFLESRNLYQLNLRGVYKILKKKERVNTEGMVAEFEKPRFFKNFYCSSVDFSIDTLKDGSDFQIEQWQKEKNEYFEQKKELIKFWETPLRNESLLKIMDKILKRLGIILVLKPIEYGKNYKYNTNLMISSRKVMRMISIEIIFGYKSLPLCADFETKFTEEIVSIAKATQYFKEIIVEDIVIYQVDTQPGEDVNGKTIQFVTSIQMKINQIETINDFDDFETDTIEQIQERFGFETQMRAKKQKAFFNIDASNLGAPDMTFIEKKKEKLVRQGEWGYYQPGGWIIYNLNQDQIPEHVTKNWLPVYHPIGGFNFSRYGNLGMCDDCGPNQYIKQLTNYPLDQGLFVTPRLKYVLGYNSTKVIHTRPLNLMDNDKTDYYYLIALQCYANPDKLRVPSAFAEHPKYLKKNIFGQYYIINDPKDLYIKAVLLKRLTA